MAYRRFLNDEDYLALITEEGLDMLIRDVHDRIPMAEQSAKVSVMEYLSQYYEVEKEFAKGETIRDYTAMITYPAGVYFLNGKYIYRTLTAVNGYKKPTSSVYWEETTDVSTDPRELEKIPTYSQLGTYMAGTVVRFGTGYWKCLVNNGFEYNDIRIPGERIWDEVIVAEWDNGMPYKKNDLCTNGGLFYIYTSDTPTVSTDVLPKDDTNWSLIGSYSNEYNYDYSASTIDYVVSGNKLYKPIANPNADTLTENVNYVRDDPRNPSLVKHMTQLSLYQLHMLISPTNISETRRIAYEDSMDWLLKASKFKITIDIPRKCDHDNNQMNEYATETFERKFNPWENPWLV